MTLEAGKEMDRLCVMGWLSEVYRHPTVAFNTYSDEQQIEFAHDALVLLKEQEAVKPKQVDLYGNDEWWGLVCVCPDCNAEWMTDKANTHFCPNCGRTVKWE